MATGEDRSVGPNYRRTQCCANCGHQVNKADYDTGDLFHCVLVESEPPIDYDRRQEYAEWEARTAIDGWCVCDSWTSDE